MTAKSGEIEDDYLHINIPSLPATPQKSPKVKSATQGTRGRERDIRWFCQREAKQIQLSKCLFGILGIAMIP